MKCHGSQGGGYSKLDKQSQKRPRTGYTGLFLCHSIKSFLIQTAWNLKMVMNTGVKERKYTVLGQVQAHPAICSREYKTSFKRRVPLFQIQGMPQTEELPSTWLQSGADTAFRLKWFLPIRTHMWAWYSTLAYVAVSRASRTAAVSMVILPFQPGNTSRFVSRHTMLIYTDRGM